MRQDQWASFRGTVIGVLIAGSFPAMAAVGQALRIGKANTADARTRLIGDVDSSNLQIVNQGTGTALDLRVQPGSPPLLVNRAQRVPRLNADRVDGKHASDFLGAAATAADSDLLDGLDSTAFLGSTATAVNADKVDGKDSTAFLGAGAKAADSDLLDGLDSTAFLPVAGTATNADTLDGFDAGQLFRVASAENNVIEEDVFGSGDSGDVVSVSIEAPVQGWLLIWARVDAFLFDPDNIGAAGFDRYTCDLPLDGVQNTWTEPPCCLA